MTFRKNKPSMSIDAPVIKSNTDNILFTNSDKKLTSDNNFLWSFLNKTLTLKNMLLDGINNIIKTDLNTPTDLKIETGTDKTVELQTVVWDDLRVSPNSLPSLGAQAPQHKIIANSPGTSIVGDSIGFDGNNQYATLPDNSELDAVDDASFSFWIKPYSVNGVIFFRDNYIKVRKFYANLVISFDNSWEIWINNALVDNANHHIGISFEKLGNVTNVKVYINGVNIYDNNVWGYALSAQSSDLLIGSDGNEYINADIDEFHMYNKTLSQSQFNDLYNGGDGTTSVPTGITESTDLVFRFHFDSPNVTDNDSTLGAGHDLILFNTPSVEDPLITSGGTSGSFGVTSLSFPAGQTSQIFFTAQLPHTYKKGTDILPHVHWMHQTSNTGNIVWGLEYMWVNINDSLDTNTSIIEKTQDVETAEIHKVTTIGILDGIDKNISSILTCRLYRKGDDVNDTYPDEIFLGEFDFHFQINTLGSRQEFIK